MATELGHRVIVAGIGPGHPDYLLPAAKAAIEGAACLVGGRRALADYAQAGQKTMPVTRDIPAVLAFIKESLLAADVVVMVSGDPGYFSLLDALRRELPAGQIRVIPGISSFQLAFARLALPWHEARLLSFHGRMPEESALAYAPGRILGMLTDTEHNSQSIARLLLEKGWPGTTRYAICARLSYADEQVERMTLREGAGREPVGNCILIVEGVSP